MKTFLDKTYVTFLLIILYRILLDYLYFHITTEWEYAGFVSNGNFTTTLLSWVIFIALTLAVLPYFKNKNIFYPDLIILLFLMRIVPLTCIIKFIKQPDNFILWESVFWLLLVLLPNIIRIRHVPLLKFSSKSNIVLNIALLVFSGVVLFISGYYAQFRFHLSLMDVYELREESSTIEVPSLLGYLWAASTNILPLLFAYYFLKKKKLICFFIAVVIILNFSINGMKSTLFKLILCLVFCFINSESIRKWFTPSCILLIVTSITEYTFIGISFIHDVLIRRVFLYPSLLDTFYYDYVTKHGLWFYNRTGTKIQYLIGQEYHNNEEACNNGLFSDAYMNLGAIGCIVYPLVLVLFFKICCSAFRGVNKGLALFSALLMSFTIINSEFTTTLLTHGLFLYVVIMYIMSCSSTTVKNRIRRDRV